MSTKQKTPLGNPKFSVDGFGVITWTEGQDPFGFAMSALQTAQAPEDLKEAATQVHADMTTARAIAVSLFGTEWRDFVMDVYDRLQTAMDDDDEDDEEPEDKPEAAT